MPAAVAKIAAIEHRGDEMTHRILIKLNQTFITPFDREDIHLLASSLDDVLDFIFAASNRLLTYKITQPSPSAKVLAAIILKQAEELGKAVVLLDKDDSHLLDHCVEVNRLENEADKVSREAIGRLFDGELRSHHADQAERASGDPRGSQRQSRRRGRRARDRRPQERLRLCPVSSPQPSIGSAKP